MATNAEPITDIKVLQEQSLHDGVVFAQLDLQKMSISEKEFQSCGFRGMRWSEGIVSNCTFANCTFDNCDLSLVRLYNSAFYGAAFVDCKLMGVNWADARRVGDMSFQQCILDYSSFVGTDFRKTAFSNSRIVVANFTEANLSECDFAGCDLSGSRFLRTNLSRADLSTATGFVLNPIDNNVKGMTISLSAAVSLTQMSGIRVHGF
jgi:fluoroquinolone resistance protein